MKKYLLILLLFLPISSLRSQEYPSQLTDLLKCLFTDSESGYVFFGSKPVCYFAYTSSPDAFQIGTSIHEQGARLRLGIHWWESARPSHLNDDFVLKIKQLADRYEILSLNKKQILQAVEDNLSLFRYILGPKITPENLFTALATSDVPFSKLLHHNNVLIGILLGFGTENSLVGARREALSDFQFVTSEIPYATLSNHSPEEALGYLEISLLYKDNFKRFSKERWEKSFEINSIEEEVQYIQNLEEPPSHLLSTYSPRFILGSYQLQKNNSALLAIREEEQQKIIELLRSNDFTHQVLKRLNIVYSNVEPNIQSEALSATALANALINSTHHTLFDDLEEICVGIKDADLGRTDRYSEPDIDQFYELLTLKQLEKNMQATESYFNALRQDSTFREISNGVYIKNFHALNEQPIDGLQKNLSKVILSYTAYLPLQDELLAVKAASHMTLNLNEAIQGVALGLQGMKPGELREIHLSPEAAYGFIADLQTSGPLKFLVRLESIEDSPPLVLNRQPVSLNRPLMLSVEEVDTLNQLRKALSYQLGKTFWAFYQKAASFSGDRLIEQLNAAWNKPGHVDSSLDFATLAIYAERHQEEKNRVKLAVENSSKAIELVKDLLYVEYEKQGDESASWPKSISLVIKDMAGKILKTSSFDQLTQNECARFCKGLQEGLKNSKKRDKGTLLIDPDLADQGLFRNKLFHLALRVEFEVQ